MHKIPLKGLFGKIKNLISRFQKRENNIEAIQDIPKPEDYRFPTNNGNWLHFSISGFKLVIANFAVFLAFLSVLGYLVFRSYISKYGDLFTLNISPGYYIASGINLLIGFIIFFRYIFETYPLHLFCTLVFLLIIIIFLYINFFRYKKSIYLFYLIFSATLLSFFLAFTFSYGSTVYPQIPQIYGGGQVTNVILVFKENSLSSFEGILTADPKYPNRTEVIEMLLERTDGWMVRDKAICKTVFVKSDLIEAIVDPYPRFAPTTTPTPNTPSTPTVLTPACNTSP